KNPEPYGGSAMLQRIKEARESNASELDLGGFFNISDLTPLAGAGLTNLKILYLEYNNVSDLTPLAEITSLTAIDFYGNNISDLSITLHL
ncbi:MAG: leucine-rich repeat domain-containing protein, partial [Verrucomicrobiota bacterium]|nr:leucine-rich repeat domain-containing protein [Verrucomicrobiota bacterium]